MLLFYLPLSISYVLTALLSRSLVARGFRPRWLAMWGAALILALAVVYVTDGRAFRAAAYAPVVLLIAAMLIWRRHVTASVWKSAMVVIAVALAPMLTRHGPAMLFILSFVLASNQIVDSEGAACTPFFEEERILRLTSEISCRSVQQPAFADTPVDTFIGYSVPREQFDAERQHWTSHPYAIPNGANRSLVLPRKPMDPPDWWPAAGQASLIATLGPPLPSIFIAADRNSPRFYIFFHTDA